MSQYEYRPEYERSLPHFQPAGATLFVTFRLAGSIPQIVMERLKAEAAERERVIMNTADPAELADQMYEERKKQFGRWDIVLDNATDSPFLLRKPEIAEIVVEALHYRDGKVYDLDVFCVMPNHAHVVFRPLQKDGSEYHALQTIMHSLKRHTARQANKILKREGAFWQHESYDHVIRDQKEWERIVAYILNNPVKAGFVDHWQDWPWTWLKM
jgi:REP element-mobilizing transposase RayT